MNGIAPQLAGYETTANAMNTTVLLLSGSPSALAAVEVELDSLGLLRTTKCRKPRCMDGGSLSGA